MSDKTDKDKEAKEEVYKQGVIINASGNRSRHLIGHFPELGLCNHCANLRGIVTEFGAKRTTCYGNMAKLDGKHRIKDCSSFWDRTYVGIESLLNMCPILIEPKEEMGF